VNIIKKDEGAVVCRSVYRRNRKRKPRRIIIDADSTDDPTYRDHQLTFFHGYYDQYMYHPLLVYTADTVVIITVAVRAGNGHASYGIVSVPKFEKNRFVEIH